VYEDLYIKTANYLDKDCNIRVNEIKYLGIDNKLKSRLKLTIELIIKHYLTLQSVLIP